MAAGVWHVKLNVVRSSCGICCHVVLLRTDSNCLLSVEVANVLQY
jgi:hypothetical protein